MSSASRKLVTISRNRLKCPNVFGCYCFLRVTACLASTPAWLLSRGIYLDYIVNFICLIFPSIVHYILQNHKRYQEARKKGSAETMWQPYGRSPTPANFLRSCLLYCGSNLNKRNASETDRRASYLKAIATHFLFTSPSLKKRKGITEFSLQFQITNVWKTPWNTTILHSPLNHYTSTPPLNMAQHVVY